MPHSSLYFEIVHNSDYLLSFSRKLFILRKLHSKMFEIMRIY